MSRQLVIPEDGSLIERLDGHRLTVRTTDPLAVTRIMALELPEGSSAWLSTTEPLSTLPLHESWSSRPLTLQAGGMGLFRDLVEHLPLLRRREIRTFLPPRGMATLQGLPVLASVGVRCGAWMDGVEPVEFEAMGELLDFIIYSRVRHAPMEPFLYLTTRYRYDGTLDAGPLFFDDPASCLHIDGDENIALSAGDLEAGRFVARGIEALETIEQLPAYQERMDRWQTFFLDDHPCASCSAWRACSGRFAGQRDGSGSCTRFFEAVIEAAAFIKKRRGKRRGGRDRRAGPRRSP